MDGPGKIKGMAARTGSIKIKLTVDDKGTVKLKQFGDTATKAGKQSKQAFTGGTQTIGAYNDRLRTGNAALLQMTSLVGGLFTAYSGMHVASSIFDIGKNFEQTMVTVGGVSKATQDELTQLEASARTVGAETEKSARQAGDALKYMAMAGFTARESIAGLPGVTDLSTAAQLDLARATDISTDMLGAFGKDVSYLSRLNDIFVGTVTRSNTTVEMLAEGLKYVAPVASQLGYSVENTNAMLGVLANASIKGSDAGTDLRQALIRTSEAAQKLGMDDGATLIDVLGVMKERQMGVNEVVDMFGLIASKSVLVLMENIAGYEKLNEKLDQSQGEAKELAETMRSTINVQMQKLWSAMESVGLDIFDRYKERISGTIETANQMITLHSDRIVNLVDGIGTLIGYVDELVIAFAAVKGSTAVLTFFDAVAVSSGGAAAGVTALTAATKKLAPVLAGIMSYKAGEWISNWSAGVYQMEKDIDRIRAHTAGLQKEIDARLKDMTDEEKIVASFEFDNSKANAQYIDQQKAVEDDVTEVVLSALGERLQGHLNVLEQWEAASRYSNEKSYEEQRQSLDAEYQLYQQHVTDLSALDQWYVKEKQKLDNDQANEQLALYEKLVKAGYDEYIDPLIDAKEKILDAEEKQWAQILDSDSAAYDLRLAEEDRYIDSVLEDIDRVVDAEQDAADERIEITRELADERVQIEQGAHDRIVQLKRFSNEPVGPGSGFTVWNGTIYRTEADAIAAIDRFKASQEAAQQAAEAAARERERQVEEAARSTARALENAARESERMADAAAQAAERLADSFTSSYENFQNYVIGRQRQDWGIDDWSLEFGRLAELFTEGLADVEIHPEEQLDLLDDMVSVLRQIDSKEQQQIDQFQNTFFSIGDMINEMTYGAYASSTSYDQQQARIDEITRAIADLEPGSDAYISRVDSYLSALPDYLDFMQVYAGEEFQRILNDVITQLKEYQIAVGFGATGYSIHDLITIDDEEKLNLVWSDLLEITNDYPVQKLSEIYEIVDDYGLQSLKELYEIVEDYGVQSLQALYQIKEDYGVQSLQSLYEIIEDYEPQQLSTLYQIIEDYGVQSLQALYQIDQDYGIQSVKTIYPVARDYGYQSVREIYPILNDYDDQQLSDLFSIMNDYGEQSLRNDIFPIVNDYGLQNVSNLYRIYHDPADNPEFELKELVRFTLKYPQVLDVASVLHIEDTTATDPEFNYMLADLITIWNDLESQGISDIYLSDYFAIIDDLQTGNIDDAQEKINLLIDSLGGNSGSLADSSDTAIGSTEAGGLAGLIGALDVSHGAFSSAINDLNDLATHTQQRLSEVESFFAVLADRMGISYGQGVSDTVISNLTQTEYMGPQYEYITVPWVFAGHDFFSNNWHDKYILRNPSTGQIESVAWIAVAGEGPLGSYVPGKSVPPDPTPVRVKLYAKGGYSDVAAIFGESGGEWAVPAHNNPNNENFLKSVGASPEQIARAILHHVHISNTTQTAAAPRVDKCEVELSEKSIRSIARVLTSSLNIKERDGGDIHVMIDEKTIANAWNRQARNNRQTQRIIKRESVWS
jgi:TP901 family phage tail tape measure protein